MTDRHGWRTYLLPPLVVLLIGLGTGVFRIDPQVVNHADVFSPLGRTRAQYLAELNLPRDVGAVLVAGQPNRLVRSETLFSIVGQGELFTHQLWSLLFNVDITDLTIAAFINGVFCVSALLFSLLAGYAILGNGYLSIPIFALLALFRVCSPGLIYGLPDWHRYSVFNPLIMFSALALMVAYLEARQWRVAVFLTVFGFLFGYTTFLRSIEGWLELAALVIFLSVVFLQRPPGRSYARPILIVVVFVLTGFLGFYLALGALRFHRDSKLHLEAARQDEVLSAPLFHPLYIAMFRYQTPNRFDDSIGYEAFFDAYPEKKAPYDRLPVIPGTVMLSMPYSIEYSDTIRRLYFRYIAAHPRQFVEYLARGSYDYFLFLPYYSWSGRKSAQAYIPSINPRVQIDEADAAYGYRNTHPDWILNLRWKYFPSNPLFYLYFFLSYVIVAQALWVAVRPALTGSETDRRTRLLLQGMLIYFGFCSIVRIVIPVHGQSAAIAFNAIVIFNLVRLTFRSPLSSWRR